MGYGEFTRAAGRPSASAAGGAPETQARLGALPEGRTSPHVTRQGRKSSLTPISRQAVASLIGEDRGSGWPGNHTHGLTRRDCLWAGAVQAQQALRDWRSI